MKIERKEEKSKSVELRYNIKTGDCFEFYGDIYILLENPIEPMENRNKAFLQHKNRRLF